ncbi:MAG: hypothetical protein ACI4I3_08185 [Acutalibacteraceae bacterium]
MLKAKNKLSSETMVQLFWSIFFVSYIVSINPLFAEHDTWFLLNTGRYILQNGFPTVEPFTIHQDLAFIVPQWLSAVSFWLVYKYTGSLGLWILRALTASLFFFISYKLCMLVSNKNLNISCILTFLTGYVYIRFCSVRPQIYTSLIFILELYLLEKLSLTKNVRYAVCLPLLSLLLINCSCAMWPMLFVLALPYVVESFLKSNKYFEADPCPKLYLFISLAVSFLMGFVNPYGFKGMTYLLRSFGQEEINNFVFEMKPPTYRNCISILIFIAFVVLIYIFFKCTYKPRYFFLTAGTTVLVLMSIRNWIIFAIASMFPLAFYLKDYNIDFKLESNPRLRRIFKAALVMLSCVLVVVCYRTASSFITLDLEESEPKAAVDYILSSEDPETVVLYTSMNEGSYTEYRGLKSFGDTRMEVLVKENNKKKDYLAEWAELQGGDLHYKKFLDEYNFTHILTSKGRDILYTYLLEDSDYKIAYEDDTYCLFVPLK